jgi:hypothetical protein
MRARALSPLLLGFLVACARAAYAPPHQAILAERQQDGLTNAQRAVVLTVLQANKKIYGDIPHESPEDVFYALPKGVLVLYYGDLRYPGGTTPPGVDQCPDTEIAGCRQASMVIGSENLIYYPAPEGGPGPFAGERMSAGPGEKLAPLDIVARRAYEKYGVLAPWSADLDFGFEHHEVAADVTCGPDCLHSTIERSYSRPRQALTSQLKDLSSGQSDAVRAVLHAGAEIYKESAAQPKNVFYVVPNGILVLYFGDPRYSDGLTPVSQEACSRDADNCAHGVSVIGCNAMYYPNLVGGPGAFYGRIRIDVYSDVPSSALDGAARQAYRKYGLPLPCDPSVHL